MHQLRKSFEYQGSRNIEHSRSAAMNRSGTNNSQARFSSREIRRANPNNSEVCVILSLHVGVKPATLAYKECQGLFRQYQPLRTHQVEYGLACGDFAHSRGKF
jgi:hypothetical protein